MTAITRGIEYGRVQNIDVINRLHYLHHLGTYFINLLIKSFVVTSRVWNPWGYWNVLVVNANITFFLSEDCRINVFSRY